VTSVAPLWMKQFARPSPGLLRTRMLRRADPDRESFPRENVRCVGLVWLFWLYAGPVPNPHLSDTFVGILRQSLEGDGLLGFGTNTFEIELLKLQPRFKIRNKRGTH
jgi:hypothetical protein